MLISPFFYLLFQQDNQKYKHIPLHHLQSTCIHVQHHSAFFDKDLMIIKKTFKQMCIGRRYMQLWRGKKVLLVAKYTRVERERLEHPNVSEKQLLNQLSNQGANLKTILESHNEHYNIVKEVTAAINRLDVESKIINLKVSFKSIKYHIFNNYHSKSIF